METKQVSRVFILTLCIIVTCVLSASADPYLGGIPLETVREGIVSGGLYVDGAFPMATDGTATFVLPEHTAIQWARLYVVVYCGHMQNNYQARADIEFKSGQGTTKLATEILNVPYTFPGEGGTGPVRLNDHVNRVTSDYLMWYDVGDRIKDKNILVRVKTSRPQGYSGTFDGRIKAIVLVVAYDDGDQDKVYYWVNQGHDEDSERTEEMLGETYVGETTIPTRDLPEDWENAELVIVHLASRNAEYEFCDDALAAGKPQGAYAGIDKHDVTDSIRKGRDSDLSYDNTARYFKIILATLAVRYPGSETGSLLVTSDPPGAIVTVDGERREQRTNTTFSDLLAGNHVVKIEKEGYRAPPQRTVLVQTNQKTSVHFTLQQGKGTIVVESTPAGAEVLIDGVKHTDLSPCTIPDVPAGERNVSIRIPGYREYVKKVNVSDGETLSLKAELLPEGTRSESTGGSSLESAGSVSGYRGSDLTLYRKGTLQGSFFSTHASDYTGMIPSGQEKVYTLPDPLPGDGKIVLSRLYLYTTWSHDTTKKEGAPALPAVYWNGQEMDPDAIYTDRKGDGIYDYPVQTFAYDGEGIIKAGEQGIVTVRNNGESGREFAAYGVLLIALVEKQGSPELSYWICEGSDIIFADSRFGTTAEDARTRIVFSGNTEFPGVHNASLILVSTAASGEEEDRNLVVFNNNEWYNILAAGSSGISVAELDVLPWLSNQVNTVEIASVPSRGKGDYMENRNIILVLTHGKERVTQPGEGQKTGETAATSGIVLPVSPSQGREPLGFSGSVIEWIFGVLFRIFDRSPPPYGSDFATTQPQQDFGSGNGLGGTGAGGQEDEFEEENLGVNSTFAGDSVEEPQIYITSEMETSALDHGEEKNSSLRGRTITGGIFVNSYPTGVTVFIDGKKVLSRTPLVANWLKEGLHTIRVDQDKSDFIPDTRQVWVQAGEITPLFFTSGEKYFRTLTLDSQDFKGDSFTVNGRGPILALPAKVVLEGHSPYVTIMSNGKLYSQTILPRALDGSVVFLTKEGGAGAGIMVTSSPSGGHISIDGFPMERVTPALIGNLSPGQHLITVSYPGYYPGERLITLVDFAGEPVDMSVDLSLDAYRWGNLTVESDPPDARIYIFGKDTGRKTPARFEFLQIGAIQGRIRWEDSEKDFEGEVLPVRDVVIRVEKPGGK
jgi:hypothetical protein